MAIPEDLQVTSWLTLLQKIKDDDFSEVLSFKCEHCLQEIVADPCPDGKGGLCAYVEPCENADCISNTGV